MNNEADHELCNDKISFMPQVNNDSEHEMCHQKSVLCFKLSLKKTMQCVVIKSLFLPYVNNEANHEMYMRNLFYATSHH